MFRSHLVCLLMVAFLAACGGGGGGGDGSVPTDPGAGGGATGLVPAAPSLGATLYSNATVLRPLLDGARWQYYGAGSPNGVDTPTRYTASVSHKLVGGSLQETESFVFLEADGVSTLALSGTSIVAQVRDPLGIGSSEVVTITELRSPVRANDQYTQYERSNVSLGSDIDGDGQPDVADVAIYSRVIGDERVELPELSRSVMALRVETTALVRVMNSSNQSQPPVGKLVQTQWYAAGIGVVRRTLTVPTTSSGIGPIAYDEVLFSWDGVTQGLGALGPTPAWIPNSVPSVLLPDTLAATVVGDRALALTGSLQLSDPGALTLGVFDKGGALLSVRQAPGLGDSLSSFSTPQLFGLDGSTALAVIPLGPSPGTLRLQRIDADGAPVGNANVITVPTDNINLPMAWDGQALWVAWLTSGSQFGDTGKLALQPFDPDGQPLAPVQILDTPTVSGQIGSLGMSAAAGRLLVSWARTVTGTADYRYAILRGASSTAEVRTLGTVQRNASPQPALIPVQASGIAALLWNGPVFTYTSGGPLPDPLPRGVVLDANGDPVRSGSGSLDEERLPAEWVGNSTRLVAQALGDRLVISSFDYQRALPQLPGPTDFILTGFVQPGSQSLAASSATASTLSCRSGTLTNFDQFGLPAFVLLWDDRALVIGNNSGRTMTSVFWLR